MQKTGIEWTATYHPDGTVTPGYSSNPIRAIDNATGKRGWACQKVSAGCDNCYAETLNRRWGTGHTYDQASESSVTWQLNHAELRAILKSKATNARVFLGDMTDIFHPSVERAWLDQIFAVIALRPDLTFQLLTKRPQFAARYLGDDDMVVRVGRICRALGEEHHLPFPRLVQPGRPLENVWLGTSVEQGTDATRPRRDDVRWRIRALIAAPAVVHFLSVEPLIGPLDLAGHLGHIEWVIVGGESNGPPVRRLVTHLGDRISGEIWTPTTQAKELVRGIRDQCLAGDVAFFLKQWGGPTPKAGGRKLDGREWNEFPVVAVPA